MVRQFALAIDKYAINGATGTPSIKGLLNTTGIYDADLGTAALPSWTAVNHLKALIDQKAVDLETCSYITDPLLMGILEVTPKFANGFGGPIADANVINGYKALTSTNVLTSGTGGVDHTLIMGDFSNLEICLQGPTEFMLDIMTRFDEGITILTARQYFDIGVLQPSAFAACKNFLVA